MNLHSNFHTLPEEGRKINLDVEVFVLNDDLSLNVYKLKDFFSKYKEYAHSPEGVSSKYFIENNELKCWEFGDEFLIHRYESAADAQNALKVFDLDSVLKDSVPLFFYSKEAAEEAIIEMYTEEEISDMLGFDRI